MNKKQLPRCPTAKSDRDRYRYLYRRLECIAPLPQKTGSGDHVSLGKSRINHKLSQFIITTVRLKSPKLQLRRIETAQSHNSFRVQRQKVDNLPSQHQCFSKHPRQLKKRAFELRLKFDVGNKQIENHSCPNLRQHR